MKTIGYLGIVSLLFSSLAFADPIADGIRASGKRGELFVWPIMPLHAEPRVGDRTASQIRSTRVALAGKEQRNNSKPYANWTTEITSVSPESIEIVTVNQAKIRTRAVVDPTGKMLSHAFLVNPEVLSDVLPADGSDPRLVKLEIKDAPPDIYVTVPAGRFRVSQIIEAETYSHFFKRGTRQFTIVYLSDEVPLREVLRETTVVMEDPAFSWEKVLEAATTIYFKNLNAANPRTILESLNAAGAAAKATKNLGITRTELVSYAFATN